MFSQSLRILVFCAVAAFAAVAAYGQGSDPNSPFPGPREAPPKGVREMMDKLRIEKEKKDYEEMLERGENALKLSSELETSLSKNSQLTDSDRTKLASLEKLVKKIREDLGGDDDDEAEAAEKEEKPSTIVQGFRSLKEATVRLVDELKKTTRFSISAAAIQTSNTVLRMTRFLRFWR